MSAKTDAAAQTAIEAACRELHLPSVRAESAPLAEQAARERLTHRAYLAELLGRECDDRAERRRVRRISEARFPRMKRLEDFDLKASPAVQASTIATLAAGEWIDRGQPVVLLGDSGTGKTHLLIGLGVAACAAGRRVRYTTTAALANELAEAADERVLSRVVAPLRPPRSRLSGRARLRAPRSTRRGAAIPDRDRA